MTIAYFVLAGMCVVLWIPILLRFYRSWLSRHNPISLAICAFILLLIWFAVSGGWLVSDGIDKDLVATVSTGMSTLVALYSHLAFRWSKKKFPEQRGD